MIEFLPLLFAPLFCDEVELDHGSTPHAGPAIYCDSLASSTGELGMKPRAELEHDPAAPGVYLFDPDLIAVDGFERAQ